MNNKPPSRPKAGWAIKVNPARRCYVHTHMTRNSTLLAALLPLALLGNTWTVGPGHTYTLPSQVSTLVGNGDTVNIMAGTYPGDVARWQANDLVLRGVGGLAHLESNGNAYGGKAIWVIQGDRTTVEWIQFSECAVPDDNGAGIRQEGHHLTVRHCRFLHNQDGILAGTVNPSTIRIERCEFGYNGAGDGYSHNLYINNVDSLIFRFNYCHHAVVGHELKSRARVNVIEYNRFSNEDDGTASREIDLPNGGQAYLIGNVIQQGPQGENSNMVGFGLEGLNNPGPHELYAINNSLVNLKANGTFFQTQANVYFKAYNNILAGGGSFMSVWPTSLDTLANLRRNTIAAVGFDDVENVDLHISEASPAHGLGVPAGSTTSGFPLVALFEYVHPMADIERCQHALLDAGAFEACTSTGITATAQSGFLTYPNPATDWLTIRLGKPRKPYQVRILDALGQPCIEKGPIKDAYFVMDVSGLPAGLYLLQVGEGPSLRFVKQ